MLNKTFSTLILLSTSLYALTPAWAQTGESTDREAEIRSLEADMERMRQTHTAPQTNDASKQPHTDRSFSDLDRSISQQDGIHQHDGFYLRLHLGFGGTAMESDTIFGDTTIFGGAGDFNLEIGGALTENFILFGKLFSNTIFGPDVEIDNTTFGTPSDTQVNTAGLGIGITYYFMPRNIFLSAAMSVAQISIDDGNDQLGRTDGGGVFHFGVGKEWWISDNWGIGLSGNLMVGRIEDQGRNANPWTVGGMSLAFSATYN